MDPEQKSIERLKAASEMSIHAYGLTRTGCCGCPISYKAVEDLEKIRPYEPNLVTAVWNVFGKSYEYRAKYNAYKEQKMRKNREDPKVDGQISIWGEVEI